MANVVEIILQAKGDEEVSQSFDKLSRFVQQFNSRIAGMRAQLDALRPSSAALGASLDRVTQPRTVRLDSTDIERMRQRVKDLEASLEPARLQAKIRALQNELRGGGGGGFLGGLNNLNLGSLTGFASSLALLGGAGFIASQGIERLIGTAKSFINQAADAELQTVKFAQSLVNIGQFSQQSIDRMKAFAAGIQEVTTQSDEAVLSAAALLAQIGGLSGPTLERATAAAVQLAAVLGTDLQTAAQQLARAANGSTQGLERLIGQIESGATPAETFANVLARLEQLSGAAEVQANTFSGSVKQLGNQLGELGENKALPYLEALTGALQTAVRWLATYNQLLSFLNARPDEAALDKFSASIDKARFNTAAAKRALDELLQSQTIKTLELVVRGGDIEEARRRIAELRKERDALDQKLATPSTSVGIEGLDAKIAELEAALDTRVRVDTEKAASDLAEFGKQFEQKPLVARVQVDASAIASALAIDASLTVPVSVDAADLQQQVVDPIKKLEEIKANIGLTISKSSVEQLEAQKKSIEERLAKTASDFQAKPSDENLRLARDQAVAIANEFNRLSPIRMQVLVEEKAIDQIGNIRRAIEEAANASRGVTISVVSEEDLQRSRTLQEEFGRTQNALQALIDTGKTPQAATSLNGLLVALAELGRQVPERRNEIEAFAASLRQRFSATIALQLDASAATRQFETTKALLADLSKIEPGKLAEFDTSQLVRGAETVQRAFEAIGPAIDRALTSGDFASATGALFGIDAAIQKIAASADAADLSVLAFLATARDDARQAVAALEPLADAISAASQISTEIRFNLQLGDLEAARRGLRELEAQVARFPTDLRLRLELQQAQDGVADFEASMQQLSETAQVVMQTIQNGLVNVLAVPFESLLDDTKNFHDAMVSAVKNMVDAIIKELLRLAVFKLFGFLLGGIGGGVTSAIGTSPIAPKVSALPPIPVIPPAPAITFEVPPATAVLKAPDVRIPDLGSITIPSPEVLAPPSAVLAIALDPEPLAPIEIAAPQARVVGGLRDITLTPPGVSLAPVGLASPDVVLGGVAPQFLDPPAVTIGTIPGSVLAPPNVSVQELQPISLTPTLGTVAPLPAISPDLRLGPIAQDLRLDPPSVVVDPLPGSILSAPSVTVGALEAIALPAPAVTVGPVQFEGPQAPLPPQIAPVSIAAPDVTVGAPVVHAVVVPPVTIQEPQIRQVRARIQEPTVTVPDAPSVAIPAPNILQPTIEPQRVAVSAPTFDVQDLAPTGFLIDAPTLQVGTPDALAPVPIDVPVVVPSVSLPQVDPARLTIPEPLIETPRVPRVRIAAPAVDAPQRIQVASPRVAVGVPVVSVPRIQAPTVRLAQVSVPRETAPARAAALSLTGREVAPLQPAGRAVTQPSTTIPGARELERTLGRLAQPAPVPTRRAISPPAALEFSRTFRAAQPVSLPGFARPPREEDRGRLSRFFQGASIGGATTNVNITAMDTTDIERSARGGRLAKALSALQRSRRT